MQGFVSVAASPAPPLLNAAALWSMQDALGGLQPTEHYEDVETKRRLNNIIHVSGLIDSLVPVKARPATKAELCLVHTPQHVENIQVCWEGKHVIHSQERTTAIRRR